MDMRIYDGQDGREPTSKQESALTEKLLAVRSSRGRLGGSRGRRHLLGLGIGDVGGNGTETLNGLLHPLGFLEEGKERRHAP